MTGHPKPSTSGSRDSISNSNYHLLEYRPIRMRGPKTQTCRSRETRVPAQAHLTPRMGSSSPKNTSGPECCTKTLRVSFRPVLESTPSLARQSIGRLGNVVRSTERRTLPANGRIFFHNPDEALDIDPVGGAQVGDFPFCYGGQVEQALIDGEPDLR